MRGSEREEFSSSSPSRAHERKKKEGEECGRERKRERKSTTLCATEISVAKERGKREK